MLGQAIDNVQCLVLPGCVADKFMFVIKSDWSSKYAGYMLSASKNCEDHLIDLRTRLN